LVAQTVVQRQTGANLPLILRVANVILLLREALAGVAGERARAREIVDELDRCERGRQVILQTRVGVSRAAETVRVETYRADFAAETKTVIATDVVEIVDERKRIRRVRLAAAVRRRIGAHETARRRCAGGCALARQIEVCRVGADVQDDRREVEAVDRRRLTVDARL